MADMDQNTNKNAAPAGNEGGKHGFRRRFHHGNNRPGNAQDKTQASDGNAPQNREAKANRPQDRPQDRRNGTGGNNGGNGNNGGRGRNNQRHHQRGGRPDRREGERAEVAQNEIVRDVPARAPSTGNLSAAFGTADRMLDDTFGTIREQEIVDPAAEAEAKRILDAEGPLLFRSEEPVAPGAKSGAGTNDEKKLTIVGVRFKRPGKVYYFDPGQLKFKAGDFAIVETARGEEFGEVCLGNSEVPASQVVLPLRAVVRAATDEDARHNEENRAREDSAFRVCQEKIAAHGLEMKLVEAQYTFDNSKLLFYFTSDGRVDFRELVKDLAGVFRTRIELRQIGIRDEAKLLGGLGTCGRPLCCSDFLSDFGQVSIKMAKEQNLSLNSTKISGCCGRLMCCLRYEFDTYEQEIRLTPMVDAEVQTKDGRGTVISNNPLRGTVSVRFPGEGDDRGEVRTYHRDEVRVVGGKRRAEAPDKPEEETDK